MYSFLFCQKCWFLFDFVLVWPQKVEMWKKCKTLASQNFFIQAHLNGLIRIFNVGNMKKCNVVDNLRDYGDFRITFFILSHYRTLKINY